MMIPVNALNCWRLNLFRCHDPKENFPETSNLLEELKNNIEQKLICSGELEISGVLDALDENLFLQVLQSTFARTA